jgi:hypothetical protein
MFAYDFLWFQSRFVKHLSERGRRTYLELIGEFVWLGWFHDPIEGA